MTRERYALLLPRNLLRLQVPPFMNHGQHLDKIIGFDLVKNPLGVEA